MSKEIKDKILYWLKWFFFSFIWLAVLFLVVDIVTKQAIVHYFKTHAEPIVLIGTPANPFLQINYTINERAAFGFGLTSAVANRIIYIIVAIIGFGLIVGFYVYKFKKLNKLLKACLMLMSVGALGNLIDRIFFSAEFLSGVYLSTSNAGGVVDWIDFAGIWSFIFNIADSCIVVGTLIIIVYLIIDEIREMKKRRDKEVKESPAKVLSKEEESLLVETKVEESPIEEEENVEKPTIEEK